MSVGIKKKSGRRVTIGDFFKGLGRATAKPQTAAEQLAAFKDAFPSSRAKYADREKRRK